MIFNKVFIFDIFGEYGHFRKFNTTTSPLTYSIPTPSAIYGMLGAVLGIEREDSHNQIRNGKDHLRNIFSKENAAVAVQPLARVKKVHIGFNLLKTLKSPQSFFNITNRTQIEYEILKDPAFRIYLSWDHVLETELIERLKYKRFHFNPYLGISQMTANIEWVAEKELRQITNTKYLDFISAINISEIKTVGSPIEMDTIYEKVFQVETVPIDMSIDRRITRYGEVLAELNGQTIRAIPNKKSFLIEEVGNIQFL